MKENIAVLIDKLQELKNEDAAISELSHYTKQLYAELMCAKSEIDKKQSTKKVSVIMPGYDPRQETQNGQQPVQQSVASERNAYGSRQQEAARNNKQEKPAETFAYATANGRNAQATLFENEDRLEDRSEDHAETETKADESDYSPKELNDLIAERRPSLNDRLKTEREELVSRLGNVPVRDLNRAIGLNEKFGFINELFRGDQSLYSRSIKTINECKDLDQALYWIDRELKIKLGWQDKNKTVQHFYALIRKRFS